jgi:tetratricopeptide (TPR) repeat protein
LDEAVRLNRNMPDDLDTYALIVDAALVLGKVDQAEKSAQWMLNLRPEDVRSLMRGAAVRGALGDHEGVMQMLTDALARTSRTETALRAAIGVGLARASYRLGRADAAERLLKQIESTLPQYKPAQTLRREMENKP